MRNYLAINLYPDGGLRGITGPLADPGASPGGAVGVFTRLISSIIGLITIIAIIWFIFILMIGAVGIMSAGGDKQAAESARKKITTGAVGLLVAILGLFILKLITYLLGLGNPLDLQNMFSLIQL